VSALRRSMDEQAKLGRAREIQVAIARVLLEDWDPIGIRHVPEAQDEYDRYVGGVYRLLATGASPSEVARHLLTIESEHMGYKQPRPSDLLPVAEKLCSLDVKLQGQ
jgi:hypothetical protein